MAGGVGDGGREPKTSRPPEWRMLEPRVAGVWKGFPAVQAMDNYSDVLELNLRVWSGIVLK